MSKNMPSPEEISIEALLVSKEAEFFRDQHTQNPF